MKTFLHTLIAVAAFLIQTSYVQGQYTYQTAERVYLNGGTWLITDSNTVLQAGVGTGNALTNKQSCWALLGACGTGYLSLDLNIYAQPGLGPWDTISVVVYGPFADTINLGSKLINANIDTCINAVLSGGAGGIISLNNLQNYNRGDIYMILFMSTTRIMSGSIMNSGPIFFETDTSYCKFCNAQISQLHQPICTITFDSTSQKNKIIWTKDIFTPAQDYVIFRKNVSGTSDTLAFQSVSQLSEYVDVTSVPQSKSYEYKVGIRDSCQQFTDTNNGNYFFTAFTTMHLITYPAGNYIANLSWNKGSFQGPFYIYRTDPSGLTTLIDSVGATTDPQTYTDINAPAGLCSYQVGVNLNPPCVASAMPTYTIVKSNPAYVTVTGINELADLSKAISIEPNPFNQFTKVDLHLFTKQNLKVVLINLTGQVVMQFDNVKTDELIIERNNLSQGLYFLEVTGDGFYARKKLVVN